MRSTCALTGHRELPENFNQNALLDELEKLVQNGCDTFLCGMAEGFDLCALDCLVYLKEKYKIFIEACVPFPEQDMYFSSAEKKKYRTLLAWCDKKTVLFDRYTKGCFLIRDRYMVDCCDFVFAYCEKTSGGAAYTVKYAESKNIPVVYL